MTPNAGMCEKRQGDSCHKGPCSRRLQKGEGWQQEAASQERAAERRPTVGRQRNQMLEKTAERRKLQREAQGRSCVGRATATKRDGVWGGTAKSVCCQQRPCAMKTARSNRLPEDCEKANVAEGDRVRKTAEQVNASKSDRVRRKLLQAAVCGKTAKSELCSALAAETGCWR